MKVSVSITTTMTFDSHSDLDRFLTTREANLIVGFPDEIRQAQRTGKPFTFTTPRSSIGAITRSDIVVSDVTDDVN